MNNMKDTIFAQAEAVQKAVANAYKAGYIQAGIDMAKEKEKDREAELASFAPENA